MSRPFGLDQKDKVNFKIHGVQPGLQTIAMHILPNIWQSKWNEMKFGQLIEYNEKNIFFKNYAENEARRIVLDLFLFFKKAWYEVKTSGLQPSFNIFR